MHIGQGIHSSLTELLKSLGISGNVGLVSTANIYELYGEKTKAELAAAGCHVTLALIPDGETSKNLTTASQLYDTLLEANLDRSSHLISLGGGIVGDITGFVAATLFRGIPYVQIPTTLLAMVDSSIGGKTGINHALGKNLIGAFHQPRAVIIDPLLVHTLPRREVIAALAEILKVAVIDDRDFFQHLARSISSLVELSDMDLLEDAITRACAIKARIITADETEDNQRRLLNFGHTIGHALEASLGYGSIRHGEAVALGMVAAGYISTQETGFPEKEMAQLMATITQLQLPRLPKLDKEQFFKFLRHDKKVRQGKLHFVLLRTIGRPVITTHTTDSSIDNAITELQRRFG